MRLALPVALGLLVQVVAGTTLLVLDASPASAAGPTVVKAESLPQDATWGPEGSPYVIDGTVTVGVGRTLTILPGTVVKFVPEVDPDVFGLSMIRVDGGRLVADGTASTPIVFTSYYDDTAGGDTDGGGRAPSVGDWRSLSFDADSTQTDAQVSAAGPGGR